MDGNPQMIGLEQRGTRGQRAHTRAAFSLIDLMVSLVVMSVLIAVLMPAVAHVRDMALRTECRSNIRQQGLALQMYAYDRNGRLPQSEFAEDHDLFAYAPHETVHLRIDASHPKFLGGARSPGWNRWDGLGILFNQDYIGTPEVFYCPANKGLHDYPRYAPQFNGEPGPIVGNYQYRLVSSREYLSDLDPGFTIVSNATRSPEEYSHVVGNNMLKADMSVSWFADVSGRLLDTLASPAIAGRDEFTGVQYAWKLMDTGGLYNERPGRGNGTDDDDPNANRDSTQGQYSDDG